MQNLKEDEKIAGGFLDSQKETNKPPKTEKTIPIADPEKRNWGLHREDRRGRKLEKSPGKYLEERSVFVACKEKKGGGKKGSHVGKVIRRSVVEGVIREGKTKPPPLGGTLTDT